MAVKMPRHIERLLDSHPYGAVVYDMIDYLAEQYVEVVGAPSRQDGGVLTIYVGGRKTNYEWDSQEVYSAIEDAAEYAGLDIADIYPAPTHNPGDYAVELFWM